MAQDITDVDEYEELLAILDQMSIREIRVLALIDQQQRLRGDTISGGWDARTWDELSSAMVNTAKVRPDDLKPLLVGLGRTGLFDVWVTMEGINGSGHLTARYYRLRELISGADGNIIGPDPSPS